MSWYDDYIKVAQAAFKNGDKIIESINTAYKIKVGDPSVTPEMIAEIEKRKAICAGCPFNSANAEANGVRKLNLPYQHCTLCSCRIGKDNSKEYCLTCQCGISEFNRLNPDKKMPLKWEAFKF